MNDVEAKILELWNKGVSTAKIGAEVGKTKGSICGLLWRMRRRGLIIPTRQQISVSEKFHEKREEKIQLKHKERPDLLEQFVKPVLAHSLNIGFWKLKNNSCRYVVNDGRPEQFIFCGAPKKQGAYCEAHSAICYLPPRVPSKEYQRANARFK